LGYLPATNDLEEEEEAESELADGHDAHVATTSMTATMHCILGINAFIELPVTLYANTAL